MNMVNYNLEFHKVEKQVLELATRPKLLLHACCAPCASACIPRVCKNWQTTVFFYNPNITDKSEYDKRYEELYRLVDIYNEKYNCEIAVLDGGYAPEVFYELSRGLEDVPERGPRCHKCYRERLEATYKMAKEREYDYFATTLTLSPLKDEQVLNEIGYSIADEGNEKDCSVLWLPSDFKKEGGYQQSIELSHEYGLYRQNYCGCEYSKR